jgi:hypothetical protein
MECALHRIHIQTRKHLLHDETQDVKGFLCNEAAVAVVARHLHRVCLPRTV